MVPGKLAAKSGGLYIDARPVSRRSAREYGGKNMMLRSPSVVLQSVERSRTPRFATASFNVFPDRDCGVVHRWPPTPSS